MAALLEPHLKVVELTKLTTEYILLGRGEVYGIDVHMHHFEKAVEHPSTAFPNVCVFEPDFIDRRSTSFRCADLSPTHLEPIFRMNTPATMDFPCSSCLIHAADAGVKTRFIPKPTLDNMTSVQVRDLMYWFERPEGYSSGPFTYRVVRTTDRDGNTSTVRAVYYNLHGDEGETVWNNLLICKTPKFPPEMYPACARRPSNVMVSAQPIVPLAEIESAPLPTRADLRSTDIACTSVTAFYENMIYEFPRENPSGQILLIVHQISLDPNGVLCVAEIWRTSIAGVHGAEVCEGPSMVPRVVGGRVTRAHVEPHSNTVWFLVSPERLEEKKDLWCYLCLDPSKANPYHASIVDVKTRPPPKVVDVEGMDLVSKIAHLYISPFLDIMEVAKLVALYIGLGRGQLPGVDVHMHHLSLRYAGKMCTFDPRVIGAVLNLKDKFWAYFKRPGFLLNNSAEMMANVHHDAMVSTGAKGVDPMFLIDGCMISVQTRDLLYLITQVGKCEIGDRDFHYNIRTCDRDGNESYHGIAYTCQSFTCRVVTIWKNFVVSVSAQGSVENALWIALSPIIEPADENADRFMEPLQYPSLSSPTTISADSINAFHEDMIYEFVSANNLPANTIRLVAHRIQIAPDKKSIRVEEVWRNDVCGIQGSDVYRTGGRHIIHYVTNRVVEVGVEPTSNTLWFRLATDSYRRPTTGVECYICLDPTRPNPYRATLGGVTRLVSPVAPEIVVVPQWDTATEKAATEHIIEGLSDENQEVANHLSTHLQNVKCVVELILDYVWFGDGKVSGVKLHINHINRICTDNDMPACLFEPSLLWEHVRSSLTNRHVSGRPVFRVDVPSGYALCPLSLRSLGTIGRYRTFVEHPTRARRRVFAIVEKNMLYQLELHTESRCQKSVRGRAAKKPTTEVYTLSTVSRSAEVTVRTKNLQFNTRDSIPIGVINDEALVVISGRLVELWWIESGILATDVTLSYNPHSSISRILYHDGVIYEVSCPRERTPQVSPAVHIYAHRLEHNRLTGRFESRLIWNTIIDSHIGADLSAIDEKEILPSAAASSSSYSKPKTGATLRYVVMAAAHIEPVSETLWICFRVPGEAGSEDRGVWCYIRLSASTRTASPLPYSPPSI